MGMQMLQMIVTDDSQNFEASVPVDTGPEYSDRVIPEVITSFVPLNLNRKTQRDLIRDHINEAVELNLVGEHPINEFRVQNLATLAFPTLFPDGKGDPTCLSNLREISSNELESFALKLVHLLKYGEMKDGKWHYRFASHPRFAYWAYNMLYRKRLLSRGNLYVKDNPNDVDFTLEEFNEMLSENGSERCNNMLSTIFYYSKDLTGSNSY